MGVRVLIDEATLQARVAQLAAAIRADFEADAPLHLIGVLKGAFVFLADLARALEGPVTCDFIAVSSYGAGASSSGEVQLVKDVDRSLHDRHVLIVEDIVDTGLTLSYLQRMLRAHRPRSLRTVSLLSKPDCRTVEVPIEYIGFTIPNHFVVGYGLDFNEQYRNLRYIGIAETGS